MTDSVQSRLVLITRLEIETIGIHIAGCSYTVCSLVLGGYHRFNMELHLQSLFVLHVHSSHWSRPLNPPHPPDLCSYTRALLVSKDRRHLLVTPWFLYIVCLSGKILLEV
jgi:hypothetical protein